MREAGGLIAAGLLRCKNRNVPMGCFDVPARRPAAAQGAGMHFRNGQLTRPVGCIVVPDGSPRGRAYGCRAVIRSLMAS